MNKMRDGTVSVNESANILKDLWIDFTSSTSFKSKVNDLDETLLQRELFVLLDLDMTMIFMMSGPYDYTVSL